MGDNQYQKLIPGKPIPGLPSKPWNEMLDMLQKNRGGAAMQGGGVEEIDRGNYVLCKNSSGSDRSRFEILGISGLVFTPTDNLDEFKNNWAITGVTPTTASYAGKFVILQEPIANGAIGRARISGVGPCKVYINAASDNAADVKDSDGTQLSSGTTGNAQILWKESGTGTGKWALVRMGANTEGQLYLGKTQQAAQASGVISVKFLANDGATEIGSAFNATLLFVDAGTTGTAAFPRIATGKKIMLTNIGGVWYALPSFIQSGACP